ncbi:UDP-N-acetylglucosamine 2-epimerase [Adlercreutzia sp. ZJ304]|uniref:UDP-N-acetylglucosamine 2-epimerase n=1 Tax=Adlercreutzia sp. ZJ304 TaxID=2709791 RepID=UPI0024067E70|nr:UDP-N-acetylglucosamine 2-epimerase [Adlercreutzia sp. ZJ304]
MSEVIKKCRRYLDILLAHTGQNYDYNLNGVFFHDLELDESDVYLDAVGEDLGETMGYIIAKSYKLIVEVEPDAVFVLGISTAASLSLVPNDCIFRFFIWRRTTAVRMSACPRGLLSYR